MRRADAQIPWCVVMHSVCDREEVRVYIARVHGRAILCEFHGKKVEFGLQFNGVFFRGICIRDAFALTWGLA